MNIKTALIIGAAILIGAGIMSSDESTDIQYSNDSYSEESYNNNNSNQNQPMVKDVNFNKNNSTKRSSSKEIAMLPSMDPQRGIPYGHYPLPSDWKITKDGCEGPRGTKVIALSSKPMYTNQKRYQSPSQLIVGEVGKMLKSGGGKVINHRPLNNVAKNSQNYMQLIAIDNQSQYRTEAIGVNIDVNGKKEFLIVKTMLTQSQLGGMWYYELVGLEADQGFIDEAINHLIYAHANYKPNMRQVAMYKADENRKRQNSYASNNSRLRNNQRNFEAQQKAIVGANNAVNESIMSSSRSSNESFDRMNQMTQNGIYGENTVTNPYDGQQYQTNDMYDRTFMNAFGEQIQTNDQFYQPGVNDNTYGYEQVYPNGGY